MSELFLRRRTITPVAQFLNFLSIELNFAHGILLH
jgi:hypothetical protein